MKEEWYFGSKCEAMATEYENFRFTPQRFGDRITTKTAKPTLTQLERQWVGEVEIRGKAGANRGHHNHRTTNSPLRRGSSIWARARCKYYGGIVSDFVQPTELKCTSNSQVGAPARLSAATAMMIR